MSKQAAIQFQAYKLLLESNELTSRQKQLLIEFGFFKKIKSLFGTATKVGGTLMTAMKSEIYQDQLVACQKNIEKELADLKAIGAKVGKGNAFINEFLKALLDAQGIDPSAIVAVQPANDAAAPGTETGGLKPGAPVTPETLENNPALAARILSTVTKKSEEDIAAEIEKKNPNAVALTQLLSNAIAELSKQKPELVSKILGVLLNKGHVKLEGKAVNTRAALIKIIKAAHVMCEHVAVMDRWQVLAGLQVARSQLLYEGPATDDLIDGIKSKNIKNADALKAAVKGYKGDDLKDLEGSQAQLISAVKGNAAFPHFDTDLAAIINDLKKGGGAKGADASGAPVSAPEEEKKTEEVKKEFPQAFKDARAELDSNEVSDDVLTAVMGVIDKLKILKLK